MKFIEENDGWFPVRIEALPEGTVCYPHVPVYQITAINEYSSLCTWLETLLTMVWYPTTVATLSRRCRELIERAFQKTVDAEFMFLLERSVGTF
jgi:nicotinic acid phosphoribosyltransferase